MLFLLEIVPEEQQAQIEKVDAEAHGRMGVQRFPGLGVLCTAVNVADNNDVLCLRLHVLQYALPLVRIGNVDRVQ